MAGTLQQPQVMVTGMQVMDMLLCCPRWGLGTANKSYALSADAYLHSETISYFDTSAANVSLAATIRSLIR